MNKQIISTGDWVKVEGYMRIRRCWVVETGLPAVPSARTKQPSEGVRVRQYREEFVVAMADCDLVE